MGKSYRSTKVASVGANFVMWVSTNTLFSNWRRTKNIMDPPIKIVMIMIMVTETASKLVAVKKMKRMMLH